MTIRVFRITKRLIHVGRRQRRSIRSFAVYKHYRLYVCTNYRTKLAFLFWKYLKNKKCIRKIPYGRKSKHINITRVRTIRRFSFLYVASGTNTRVNGRIKRRRLYKKLNGNTVYVKVFVCPCSCFYKTPDENTFAFPPDLDDHHPLSTCRVIFFGSVRPTVSRARFPRPLRPFLSSFPFGSFIHEALSKLLRAIFVFESAVPTSPPYIFRVRKTRSVTFIYAH